MSTPSPLATAIAKELQREFRIKLNTAGNAHRNEVATVIDRAIAEHQKASATEADPWPVSPTSLIPAPLCQHCGKPEREHWSHLKYCTAPFQDDDEHQFTPAPTYIIPTGYYQLEPGTKMKRGDRRKSGMADGVWEPIHSNQSGRRVDDSMATIRKIEVEQHRPITPNQPQPGTPPQ